MLAKKGKWKKNATLLKITTMEKLCIETTPMVYSTLIMKISMMLPKVMTVRLA